MTDLELQEFTQGIPFPRWLQHLLFWLAIFFIYTSSDIAKLTPLSLSLFVYTLSLLIPEMLASYFIAYYLIPNYVLKKQYFAAFVALVTSIYLMGILGRILFVYGAEPLVRAQPFEQESLFEILIDWESLIFLYFPYMLSVVAIFLFTKLFLHLKNIQQQKLLLSKVKTESELKLLKAQLNPHFLFNTLNNIYSLALDNSSKTAASIGKLSEILDHILYRGNGQFVLLSSEVKLLANYIALEKLRYDDRLKVTFFKDIEEDVEIVPLILLSLVENAFKHGAGEDSGSPTIHIKLSSSNGLLKFIISNTISQQTIENSKETIGLNNIQKQLELVYSNSHQLQIERQSNLFTVTLEIDTRTSSI